MLESFRKTAPKNANKINVASGINIEEEKMLMEGENNNDDYIEIMTSAIIDDKNTNTNGINIT